MKKLFTEAIEWLVMVFIAALAVCVAFDVIDGVFKAYGWSKKKLKGFWNRLRKKESDDSAGDKKKEDKKKEEKKDDKKKKK